MWALFFIANFDFNARSAVDFVAVGLSVGCLSTQGSKISLGAAYIRLTCGINLLGH